MHSIPNIALIPFDAVFLQQSAIFILKANLPVVFCLTLEIRLQRRSMGWTDREDSIAALPVERSVAPSTQLQPLGGTGFDVLDHFCRRARPGMGNEQMDVIRDRPSLQQSAVEVIDDAANVSMKFDMYEVVQDWLTVLRGKDQMHENLRE